MSTSKTLTPIFSRAEAATLDKEQLAQLLQAEQHWLATEAQLPSGAITTGSTRIVPYFSNIGAFGLVTTVPQVNPEATQATRSWLDWFVAHLNRPDRFGLNGTIYDYTAEVDGSVTSKDDYDSADSYPATFATLVLRYVKATGDTAWVKAHADELDLLGQAMVASQDPADGLTWAKPNYKVKYLMDNCEVYRGFVDLAALMADVIGDAQKASYYRQRAEVVKAGIEKKLWAGDGRGYYYYAMDQRGVRLGTNWGTWYPDQMAQLWPVLWGVLDPQSQRAKELWARFNKVAPGWPTLERDDSFASAFLGLAALKMGERERALTFVDAVKARFFDRGNPWPWYSADAGWFMLLLESLVKGEATF